MFAKIFSQIYDSSIVEQPDTRFTFMDLLVLADPNGVVDMTHEAISRRTNRPIKLIRQTITELEGPDPRSRSPECNGARIRRLDEHRDWGWEIVNYDRFRQIASEQQRRQKTRERTKVYREKKAACDASVTHRDAQQRTGDDFPSSSASALKGRDSKGKGTQKEIEDYCQSIGLPRSDGTAMFLHWEEKGWAKVKDWRLTIRKWQSFGYLPSQKAKPGRTEPISPGDAARRTKLDREFEEAKRKYG